MTWRNCGSENVLVEREQTASIGTSTQKIKGPKRRGCMYWLCGGWIFSIMKGIFHVCTLGIFRRKRNEIGKTTGFNAQKTFNRTMAVCQECGNSWKVG